MRFDEQWISEPQLEQTAALAASTSHLPGEVIEVGAWQGLSAVRIANAVAPAVLHVVDHWLGNDDDGATITLEQIARDNYGIFLANMAEGTAGNFEVHKMGWREFAAAWDSPIRFLHLDASHTVDEVSGNIAALLLFAVPGGIFAGDDYGWPGVREGVDRQFGEVNSNGALWWKVIEGRDD